MADSFFKKEHNKKKALIKKQKNLKREDRKVNNNKGKGFDSMIAYVDENGHLTSTPPEIRKPEEDKPRTDAHRAPGTQQQKYNYR